MRRTPLVLLPMLALIWGCASSPAVDERPVSPEPEPVQEPAPEAVDAPGYRFVSDPEHNELLNSLGDAYENRDTRLLSTYCAEDPWLHVYVEHIERREYYGLQAVAEMLFHYLDSVGLRKLEDVSEVEPPRREGDRTIYALVYRDSGMSMDVELARPARAGGAQFRGFAINSWPRGPMVTNGYQASADRNGDGFLQGDEEERLAGMTMHLYSGPHEVRTPVDRFFDTDGDGLVSAQEIEAAARYQFVDGLKFASTRFPWQLDQMGLQRAGNAAQSELEDLARRVVLGPGETRERPVYQSIGLSFPDAATRPIPRAVDDFLERLADENADGMIDADEQQIILNALRQGQHVRLPIHRAIDRNRDGRIDWHDVNWALQTAGMGLDEDRPVLPPFDVVTPTDALLDLDGNGVLTQEEIDSMVATLAGADGTALPPVFRPLFDMDDDGEISREEIERAKPLVVYPRTVDIDRPLDEESDENSDWFVDDREIGILAGFTCAGPAPTVDERIASYRRSAEAVAVGADPARDASNATGPGAPSVHDAAFDRSAGVGYANRRLAVLDIHPGESAELASAAPMLTIFVQNAFANLTDAALVDRKFVTDVLGELEYQQSGIVDESTAIEVGRHLAADLVAVGSVHYFVETYYLNIQLIDVHRGQILASSISQCEEVRGFFDLANQAVGLLQ